MELAMMVLGGVQTLTGVVNFVCLVIFLLRLFELKGLGHGIAGFCCGLYTFIWGWQNADSLDASYGAVGLKYKQWIMLWTASFVFSIVIGGLRGALVGAALTQ
jgi:hypothetical protein